jgi:hypothetical protein
MDLLMGRYIYTGFKPAYVMIKKTSVYWNWVIYDSARSPYNEIDDQLLANTTAAETTGSEEIDFLGNGFKIRTADSDVNTVWWHLCLCGICPESIWWSIYNSRYRILIKEKLNVEIS